MCNIHHRLHLNVMNIVVVMDRKVSEFFDEKIRLY
jgi:hypothetical protein